MPPKSRRGRSKGDPAKGSQESIPEAVEMELVQTQEPRCLSRADSVASVSTQGEGGVSILGKRKRREVEVVEQDTTDMQRMKSISDRLRGIIIEELTKTHISGSTARALMDITGDYEELFGAVLLKAERLTGKLDAMEAHAVASAIPTSARATTSSVSYAAKAAAPTKSYPLPRTTAVSSTPKTYTVVVRPKSSENQTSDKVRDSVMKSVKPMLKDVCVKNVRKLKQPGVAIEVTCQKDLERFKQCKMFEAIGMTLSDPKPVGPKVVIFDVDRSTSESELLTELHTKNLESVVSKSEFLERARVCFRTKQKNSVLDNVVVELPHRACEHVCERGRIFVEWRSLRVKYYDHVNRCFKCYGFNHQAKECTVAQKVCRKCGELGHVATDCKASGLCCRNCKQKGKPADHSISSVQCPEYAREVERVRHRISNV